MFFRVFHCEKDSGTRTSKFFSSCPNSGNNCISHTLFGFGFYQSTRQNLNVESIRHFPDLQFRISCSGSICLNDFGAAIKSGKSGQRCHRAAPPELGEATGACLQGSWASVLNDAPIFKDYDPVHVHQSG